jgi:hypothetical protein
MPQSQRKFTIKPLEAGILAFALFALWNGFTRNDMLSLFWGGLIVLGLVALYFVRRKDWTKHWEEIERKNQHNR